MQRATLGPSLSPPSQNASFSCGFPAFSRRAVTWKSLTKSIPVLLGLSLFAATEVAAQYASPYLNPSFAQNNPATIVWREKSVVAVGSSSLQTQRGKPKTSDSISTAVEGFFGHVGDLFGLRSSFEIMAQSHKSKTVYVDRDGTSGFSYLMLDKTGGLALGSLAIGYTDVNKYTISADSTSENQDYKIEQTDSATYKVDRTGLSLKLSNLFLGLFQSTSRAEDHKVDGKTTNKSDSSVTSFSVSLDDFLETTHGRAIGLILGEENQNRFRLEILSQRSSQRSSMMPSRSKKNDLILEAQINDFFYLLQLSRTTRREEGTGYSSGSNSQTLGASLGIPLSESIRITVFNSQSVEAQTTYSASGEYRRYSEEKTYRMMIGYEF